MQFIKKNLANLFTLLNLSFGFMGILAITYSDVFVRGGILTQRVFFVRHGYDYLVYGSIFLFIAAAFDFLDGFTARKLNISSPVGKQLDSLADLISFGLLPAMIAHQLILESKSDWQMFFMDIPSVSFIPVLIVLASAVRLAIFNTDPGQQYYFRGLSTPANAIFWASIPLVLSSDMLIFHYDTLYLSKFILQPIVLVPLVVVFSALLVVPVPMMSFKFKSFGWKENRVKYLFVITFLILVLFFQFMALPLCILIYIVGSIFLRNKITDS